MSSTSLASSQLLARPYRYYFGRYRRDAFLGLSALIITNALDALPPLLMGRLIDRLEKGEPFHSLFEIVGIIAAVVVVLSLFRFLWRVLWGRFHHGVAADLRDRIYAHLTQLGPSFFHKNPVGELMSLISNDVNTFRMGIGPGVLVLFDGLCLFGIIVPLMVHLQPEWTWKTLVLVPLAPFFSFFTLNRIYQLFAARQDRFAEMSGVTQEIIGGVREIRSYAREQDHLDHYNQGSGRFEKACNAVAKVDAYYAPVLELMVNLGSALLLFVVAREMLKIDTSIGVLFTFYQYLGRLTWPAMALGLSLSMIQQGNASWARIKSFLSTPEDVPNLGSEPLADFESLEVRNLSFTYPGAREPALRDLSFSIHSGETVGIVGPAGAGKSTLIQLLLRFYQAPTGTLFVNGRDITAYPLEELRGLVAYVPQETFLFSDSVLGNVAMGRTTPDEELTHILSLVKLDQEVAEMPEGSATVVGERGISLSGGQKQRLALARALMRRAPLVILDDSLSAIDAETEHEILFHLSGFFSDGDGPSATTKIIVSHRLESLREADRILVLNSGRLEASGDFAELLRKSPTFRELFRVQKWEKRDEGATIG